MQVTWRANPFLRIALALITGILAASVFHDRIGPHYLTGMLLLPCLVAGLWSLYRPSPAVLTICLLSGIALSGALAWLSRLPVHDSRHFSHRIVDGRLQGRGYVQDIVVSERGTRVTVGVDYCLSDDSWRSSTGRLLLQSRD